MLVQIGLGAGFRHRAFGLMPHVIGAMLVPLVILLTAMFVLNQFPKHRALRPAAVGLLTITLVQIFLGIAAYVARINAAEYPLAMVLTTVAHVATGGLTLAASVVLAIQIRRNVHARASETADHASGGGLMNRYLELTKPRITLFILMSTGVGFLFGYASRKALDLDGAVPHAARDAC